MVSDVRRRYQGSNPHVLILVLMEYGLWLFDVGCKLTTDLGLNPCSNGIWSLTTLSPTSNWKSGRLNPCSNGIWSLTEMSKAQASAIAGLNPCSNGIWSLTKFNWFWYSGNRVLILVLMEYGLWRTIPSRTTQEGLCLNPCSNGIWSLTTHCRIMQEDWLVLILVLMEYGLWRLLIVLENNCMKS